MRILYFIVFVLFFYACGMEKKGELPVFRVDVDLLEKKSLDDFYRLKEVVKLETTDSSVMGDVMKAVATKDRIFVMSWQNVSVMIFDRRGKYLNKIERRGRGPGEYLQVTDFMVTDDPQEVIIYSREGKMNYYDWEGNFLRAEKWPMLISNVERLPDGGWLMNYALNATGTSDTSFSVRVADSEKKEMNGQGYLPKWNGLLPVRMVSSLYQDGVCYYAAPITENTIYGYDVEKNVFFPVCQFVFKGFPVPDASTLTVQDLARRFIDDYYMLSGQYVGKKTILVTAYHDTKRGEMHTLVGERMSGNVYEIKGGYDQENELALNSYMQHTGFEGNLVFYASPLGIKGREYKSTASLGYKLSGELEEEDNPLLFVYEEK